MDEKAKPINMADVKIIVLAIVAIAGVALLFVRAAFPYPDYPYFLTYLVFSLAYPISILMDRYAIRKREQKSKTNDILFTIEAFFAVITIVALVALYLALNGKENQDMVLSIVATVAGFPGYLVHLAVKSKAVFSKDDPKFLDMLVSVGFFFLALGCLVFALVFTAKYQFHWGLCLIGLPLLIIIEDAWDNRKAI